MSHKLYDVLVTHLATYQGVVAALDAKEAEAIARSVIWQHGASAPQTFKLKTSETGVEPPSKHTGQTKSYCVYGDHIIGFQLDLPASSREEAELHAHRLYEENKGPFEFDHDGGVLQSLTAKEVQS
ncbi:MAG: hypothetical protein KDJ36_05760 [Hyphomicrobiaceae bacterium]|nr:hypothetical protein [Hyphomicrobiaceae bacterium]